MAFRDITNATNQRTSLFTIAPGVAMNHKAPLMALQDAAWLQVVRNITNSTNERTFVSSDMSRLGVGHSATVMEYEHARAIASSLVLANLNSIPLDWAARVSVGGVNLSFFIVKQLPVLPPETYLEKVYSGLPTFAEMIAPRVLELTYTAYDLEGFARDIGYEGPPFPWDERRRHLLQCELDAIFAHMYGLERSELAWILDAPPPSSSFPALKRNEIKEFGEYRTQRLVLQAFDQLSRGENPDLDGPSKS